MALDAHKKKAFSSFLAKPEDSNTAWRQQQKLFANDPIPGNLAGLIQCEVEGLSIVQRENLW